MRPILFFDGACNLCHGTVRFVLAHERDATLRFASLQSEVARETLARHGLDAATTQSTVLVDDAGAHLRSEAVWRLARHLQQPWRTGAVLRFLPRVLRDAAYDVVARNREAWFGRRATCDLPSAGARERFLDDEAPDSPEKAGSGS